MTRKRRWFYSHEGRRYGPVTGKALHELAQIWQIERDDLVWSDGMKDWVHADAVPGLMPKNVKQSEQQSVQ